MKLLLRGLITKRVVVDRLRLLLAVLQVIDFSAGVGEVDLAELLVGELIAEDRAKGRNACSC